MNPLSVVNILQGTDSTREFSTGSTLPLIARPWGMHHWTLQTSTTTWLFNRRARQLQGIRLTHQPSPWMGDYASLLITPFTGAPMGTVEHQSSAYNVEDASLRPNYLRVEFLRYGVTAEMSPTEHGAVFRFHFTRDEEPRIAFRFDGEHELNRDGGTLTGTSRNLTAGAPSRFGLHFTAQLSVAPTGFAKTSFGGHVIFPRGTKQIELRLAASFIDLKTATLTFENEVSKKSVEEIESDGAKIWNDLLGRIEIGGANPEHDKTFYSCLYRCLLFPRFLNETNAKGETVHYSPYDGKVHPGPLCTDNGFWDTYRTLYPLLALVYPDKLKQMLEGWLNACREAGWAPKWASPGLRDCMIGTHFDSVVADAVAKGVTGWGEAEAFDYLWKDATVPSENGCYGRQGLKLLHKLGYLPADKAKYSVSATLDYSYDDFCVAAVARYLGKTDEAKTLEPRALFYRNLFDKETGFMRPKSSDGKWLADFNEFTWGGPFIEGGAWQHLFNVPHDVEGLAALFGGNEALCKKLDQMLALPPHFNAGAYGEEIHEMTEMALAGFGQYAHSNQPVHNFLFLYALAGQPEKTSHWVNKVAKKLYTPDSLPGDEDNGEMAAWYVWACLGLFPYCPGKPSYVRFEPAVPSATIRVPGKNALVLNKAGAGKPNLISHGELWE